MCAAEFSFGLVRLLRARPLRLHLCPGLPLDMGGLVYKREGLYHIEASLTQRREKANLGAQLGYLLRGIRTGFRA